VLGTDEHSGSVTTLTANGKTLVPTGAWTSTTIDQSGNNGSSYMRYIGAPLVAF
jgi:hypothetical protein